MQQQDLNVGEVSGQVKWFDPVKGFGFIVSDAGGADILLHANVLRNFGQSSIADGARLTVMAQRTERGVQAIEVISVDPPVNATDLPLADFADMDPEAMRTAPLLAARVKWFDQAKGFGFANAFGQPEDIFLHAEVLRRSGLADLMPGEALALKVATGKRGLMATEVHAWEIALRD